MRFSFALLLVPLQWNFDHAHEDDSSPGTFCIVAVAYLFFFTDVNLLKELDIVLFGGQLFSTTTTLYLISRIVPFDIIPGFDRLSGLIVIVAISFIFIFILARIRIFVGFFASFKTLVFIFFILFFTLQYGVAKLSGK